jgi:hypothetical protein
MHATVHAEGLISSQRVNFRVVLAFCFVFLLAFDEFVIVIIVVIRRVLIPRSRRLQGCLAR